MYFQLRRYPLNVGSAVFRAHGWCPHNRVAVDPLRLSSVGEGDAFWLGSCPNRQFSLGVPSAYLLRYLWKCEILLELQVGNAWQVLWSSPLHPVSYPPHTHTRVTLSDVSHPPPARRRQSTWLCGQVSRLLLERFLLPNLCRDRGVFFCLPRPVCIGPEIILYSDHSSQLCYDQNRFSALGQRIGNDEADGEFVRDRAEEWWKVQLDVEICMPVRLGRLENLAQISIRPFYDFQVPGSTKSNTRDLFLSVPRVRTCVILINWPFYSVICLRSFAVWKGKEWWKIFHLLLLLGLVCDRESKLRLPFPSSLRFVAFFW